MLDARFARKPANLKPAVVEKPRESFVRMTPEAGPREFPGMRKRARMAIIGEAYNGRDPDLVKQPVPAPAWLQHAFEQVFAKDIRAPDGTIRLKLRQHPHSGEWAIFSLRNAATKEWRLSYRAREPIDADKIPQSLDEIPLDLRDEYKIHLAKMLGPAYMPDREMFEMIEPAMCVWRYSIEELEQTLDAPAIRLAEQKALRMAQIEEQYLDYIWNMEVDRANQAAGSGQKMRSYPFEAELAKIGHGISWERKVPVTNADGKVVYYRIEKKTLQEIEEEAYRRLEERIAAWMLAERPEADPKLLVSAKLSELRAEGIIEAEDERLRVNRQKLAQYVSARKRL